MTQNITRYLPSAWQDEVIPEPQASPDAFIRRDGDGRFFLVPCEWNEEDEDNYRINLDACHVIAFDANQVFGDFSLTVREDGTFSTDRPVPDKANCFRIDRDTDTLATSLSELVAGSRFMGDPLEPGTYDMDAYWWSKNPVWFRFRVDADGKTRFEPCAGPS